MTPAESFNLPKEFEGFVSSADDLLQQFQRLDTEDAVKVQIYSDKSCTQAESLDLLDKLSTFIEKVSETYIWFKDSLNIALIVPDDKKDLAHFCGVVKFSDSIEDEWFVTFIALRLSEAFPNISICVTDTDGQFLLIEAADFIPDWIDPENCENRLWIRQGKVHIVALDEAGRNIHDCGIKLSAALEAVRNRPNDTVASRHVQAAIAQRTTAVYPHKAAADAHTTYCTLSSTIANLLEQHPSLVSVAVNTFCLPAAAGSNKNYIAAMNKFGSDLSELRTVPVRFTRLQYAKMMYQNFHIPKKFHEASRVVGGAENRKLTESFDIGCRLMCGIESAYQRSKAENGKKSISSKTNAQYLREAEMKNNTKSEIYYSTLHRDDSDFQLMIDTLLNTKDIKEKLNNNRSNTGDNSSLSEMKISENLLESYHTLSRTVEPDSDSWMFLSPEELDAEMEARVKKYKASDSADSRHCTISDEKDKLENGLQSPKSSISLQQNKNIDLHEKDSKSVKKASTSEPDQLQKMLDGMKSFISTKSDVSGIGSRKGAKNSADSKEEKAIIEGKIISKADDHNLSSNITSENKVDDRGEESEDLEIDFEKLMGYINNTNTDSSNNTNTDNSNNTNTDNSNNTPTDNTHIHSTEHSEKHSTNIKDAPLGDYFYDDDLIETSSEDSSDSDSDSDDEHDHHLGPLNDLQSEKITVLSHDRTGHIETNEDNRNAACTKESVLISTIGIKTVQFATSSSSSVARGSKAQRLSQSSTHSTNRSTDTGAGDDIMSSTYGISKLTLLSSAASESSSGVPADESSSNSNSSNSNINTNSSSSSSSHQGPNSAVPIPRPITGLTHLPSDSAGQGDTSESGDPRAGGAGRAAISKESEDDSDDGDSFYDDSETDSDDEPVGESMAGSRGRERAGAGARSVDPSHEHYPLSDHGDLGENGAGEDDVDDSEYLKEYEQIMESELASSTLLESFERYSTTPKSSSDSTSEHFEDLNPKNTGSGSGPEEVDVDLNFLKYLLESHASQLGAAGPATQLFSQLGIQLPHLPPMNVKTDSDAAN